MILPIILAGGNGTRLWPLSRELYPKQFLSITDNISFLQQTVLRLKGIDHFPPLVVCNEQHRFIAAEQLRSKNLEHSGIILEPTGRNTAPAIALAAMQALKSCNRDEDPILLVLAADHLIEDECEFQNTVKYAIPFAEDGKIVTFGVVPTSPEIGYGYIRAGNSIKPQVFCIDEFIEKPNLVDAKKYVDSGQCYWNSGMFLFKASSYLKELKKFCPEIYNACNKAILKSESDMNFIRVNESEFELCPSESIDYGVMEKSSDALVVSLDAGWSDIGSWSALWDVSKKDSSNNVNYGDIISIDSKNNYLHSGGRLIAAVGVENLVVVETKDAVLISKKDRVQEVKSVVDNLKAMDRDEFYLHREVYRPWGKYDSIDFGDRDKVKRITVNPGEKLSIQKHYHRSEHWVVVSGTANVMKGSETFIVTENESVYIPVGTIHALENPGKIPLEMIEVQTGSYLDEDDIVRFEDRYGRK